MKDSPTRRSLIHLRERGWIVEIVEHWNPHAMIRKDLFNCIDLVALRPGELAGIQTTTGANMAARRVKILAEPKMRAWVEAGGAIYVHGWRKVGARGKRKLWEVREERVTLADFLAASALASRAIDPLDDLCRPK